MTELMPRLYQILNAAWRRRYVIVLPMLILPFVGAAIGSLAPKQYQSHTSMLVQETAKLNPFLKDLAVSANLESRMSALKTLLHSRHILTEVAKEQHLVAQDAPPREVDAMIGQLSSALQVDKIGKDLIRISYRSSSPEGMSELLECISRYFIEELLAPERSSMAKSSTFLQKHLAQSREQLELAELALTEFRSQNADGLPELHSANVERLARIRQKLLEKRAELAGVRQSLGGLDQQLNRTDPVIAQLEAQIIALRSQLVTLMARYTEDHSKVQAVQRSLRRLRQEREAELKLSADVASTQTLMAPIPQDEQLSGASKTMLIVQYEAIQGAQQKLGALKEEVRQLEKMEQQLASQASTVGEQERQLLNLQRDLRVKRALYEDLLTRYEMAQVTGALGVFEQAERIKIIDRPYTPSGSVNMPWWLFAVAGLIGGLVLGIGLALFAELSDPTIRTAAEIEALVGLKVISRIPPLGVHHE